MRKQGDHSGVHSEAARIIPRLAPGGLYEAAFDPAAPHANDCGDDA